jgi:hypothetical protein
MGRDGEGGGCVIILDYFSIFMDNPRKFTKNLSG